MTHYVLVGYINSKLQSPVLLSETSGTGNSIEIDLSPYRLVLFWVISDGFCGQGIITPIALKALSAIGVQTQVGVYAGTYKYTNILYDGVTLTWASDTNQVFDIMGVK